jgi:hypothetical protein
MNVADRLASLSVLITRWVDDDPQPGIVEFQFSDSGGKVWTFVEKQALVSSQQLNRDSSYPRLASTCCKVLSFVTDRRGRKIAEIDISEPWGIESAEGLSRFSVFAEQLTLRSETEQ